MPTESRCTFTHHAGVQGACQPRVCTCDERCSQKMQPADCTCIAVVLPCQPSHVTHSRIVPVSERHANIESVMGGAHRRCNKLAVQALQWCCHANRVTLHIHASCRCLTESRVRGQRRAYHGECNQDNWRILLKNTSSWKSLP